MRLSARLVLPAIGALVLVSSESAAQACLGYPSFASNHLQMNAGATSGSGVERFGANLVSGSNSFFAGLGLGGTVYAGGNSSLDVRGTLGSQARSSGGRVQACPTLQVGYGFGPKDFDTAGNDANTLMAGFGLSFGSQLGEVLIPSLQLGYEFNRLSASGGGDSQSDSYGTLGFALGLKFSEELVVRPSVAMSSRAEPDREPVFGVSVAFNYGRRR